MNPAQNPPAAGPSSPLPAETTQAGVAGPPNPAQDDSGPNEAQVAEMLRWLRDPQDTRTAGELRAALRGMGDGVHPKPVPETCACGCRCEEPAEAGELCLGCKSFEAQLLDELVVDEQSAFVTLVTLADLAARPLANERTDDADMVVIDDLGADDLTAARLIATAANDDRSTLDRSLVDDVNVSVGLEGLIVNVAPPRYMRPSRARVLWDNDTVSMADEPTFGVLGREDPGDTVRGLRKDMGASA